MPKSILNEAPLTDAAIEAAIGGDPLTNASGIALLSRTVVQANVATKQALYTVPVGKTGVPTLRVVRSPSASLAAISDSLTFGFNAGATDSGQAIDAAALAFLTGATKYIAAPLNDNATGGAASGSAGAIYGCIFNDPSITATVTIDIFGYLL